MADSDKGLVGGFNFGRLNQLGATIRQSAQEISAKAAAQVNDITKLSQLKNDGSTDSDAIGSSSDDLGGISQDVNSRSVASSVASGNATSTTKSESVEKKELVEMMKKMNQKIKLLATIRQQLTEKVEKIEKEKLELRNLVVDEILNGGVNIQTEQDELAQIRAAWRQMDEQNSMSLQQLQNEFKKLHAEKQMNGGTNSDSTAWENEKQSLIQKHEQEVIKIKEELNRKVEELNSLSSSLSKNSNNDASHNAEIQKVREEAAEQLQAFRQKVVAARNAELTKLKTEMKEQAQKMLDDKSRELKEQYEAQIEDLKKRVAMADQNENAKDSQDDVTANKIAQIRMEMEDAKSREIKLACQQAELKVTSQMESKLQSAIAELSKKHDEEMDKVRKESDEKLTQSSTTAASQVQSITQKARDAIATIQKELATNKQSHEAAIKSLEEQVEATKTAAKIEMEKQLEKVRTATNASTSQSNEVAVANLREELVNASNAEREKLQMQFSQEKETMRIDFQNRYQAAIHKIQLDANKLKDDAIDKVREDMAGKLADAKKQLEVKKDEELRLALSNAEALKVAALKESELLAESTLLKTREELGHQLKFAQEMLGQKTNELQVKLNEEHSLQLKVQELQSMLASMKDGNEKNSSHIVDDALSKQRTMYEERSQVQVQQYTEQVNSLQNALNEALQSRDATQNEVISLRSDIKMLTDERESKSRENDQTVSMIKKELLDQIVSITKERDHLSQQVVEVNKKYDELQLQVSQYDDAIVNSKRIESEYSSKIASLQQDLERINQQKSENISRVEAEISQRIKATEMELQQVSDSKQQIQEAHSALQVRLNDLQNAYDSDLKRLQLEVESSKNALLQAEAKYESTICDLRKSYQANASSTEVELAEARQKLIDEKDAEIALIKATYEAKLQESAAKELTVAQSFNKVKTAYIQKLKTLETEHAEKINQLETDKAELLKAVEIATEKNENLIKNNEKEIQETRASVGKRSEELKNESAAVLEELNKKLDTAEATIKKYEVAVKQLEIDLKTARQDAESAKTLSGDEMDKEISAKLKSIDEEHSRTIAKLQSEYKTTLEALRTENEGFRAKAEFVDTLEQQKVELTSKLESQFRKNEEETAKLRKAMETHVDKMTAQFKEKLENARKASDNEINALQKLNQEKEQKLTAIVEKLKALTATSTKVRNENEGLKKRVDAELTTQNELRSKIESMKKQLEETNSNSSATTSSLLQEQEKLQHDKIQLNNQIKTLQGTNQSQAIKIEELSGKLSALTSNLNALTEERKEQDDKLEKALKLEPKLKASEAEATDLRDQINKLKLERQKNITLVERLQAEKETNERNHGQRTALVGMLESQLSQLNDKNAEINAKFEAALYDLSQKEEMVQSNEERIRRLETELEEAQSASKKISEALTAAQKNAESKSSKMVETLQRELQATKQQMVRKSSAAQRLIQQREAECAELRTANRSLQQEVDKGSYSERRIFELAAKQSNRESLQISEIEARDSIIERLKAALLERDGDLANAEKHAREIESQIEDLFRIRRREDVNIDYLKSIVVKYLSLPPGSDERARLLPVLATLLQFDDYDYKVIEEGRNKVSWWGSSVIPTLINAPSSLSSAPVSGSAEVSISQSSLNTQGTGDSVGKQAKSTSLQF